MFVFTVDAIRDAIREHLPFTAMAMLDLARDPSQIEAAWPQMEATSIDYGIMERSRHILTVPCDPMWSDCDDTEGSYLCECKIFEEKWGTGRKDECWDCAVCEAGNAIHDTVAFLGLQDSSVAFS